MLIHLCISDRKLYIDNKKKIPLLSILEKNKVYIEFQCREGFCGTCRVDLLKGKIEYIKSPIAFLHSKEILTCICIPKSDIELKI